MSFKVPLPFQYFHKDYPSIKCLSGNCLKATHKRSIYAGGLARGLKN